MHFVKLLERHHCARTYAKSVLIVGASGQYVPVELLRQGARVPFEMVHLSWQPNGHLRLLSRFVAFAESLITHTEMWS